MATNALPGKAGRLAANDLTGSPADALTIAKAVFAPLASLKLTVALLALAVIEVLLGTIAQDKLDMWEVMSEYFRAWFTWVEMRMLFPDRWFPSKPFADSYLGFPFPGGLLIGSLMAVNLVAAHTIRFKIQTRGTRLWAGLGVIAFGVLLTVLVIFSGPNSEGLQGVPMFEWKTLWLLFKVAIFAGCVGSGAWLANLLLGETRSQAHTIIAGSTCGVLALLSLVLLIGGDAIYLGDSGMRILWQLIQGGLAGVVILAGCIMAFKRRAGIVVIHSGVALMMGYELFVGSYAIEEQMLIGEGEETSQVSDTRDVEMAITGSSDETQDRVTVVPISKMGIPSRFMKQKKIEHDNLPFDIEIVDYFKNTRQPRRLRRLKPKEKKVATATAGFGQVYELQSKRPVTGADGDEQNYATVFAKFIDKDRTRDLGTYAISQVTPMYGYVEKVRVGDKDFKVELRWKFGKKPYTIHLKDVRAEHYVGTTTPKDYSSFIVLKDPRRNVKMEKRVWMNNPMRYAGETFYQTGYNKTPSGVEYTTLNIVTNTGWMAPYIGCMIVAIGMLAHFSGVLIRFLNRVASGQLSPSEAEAADIPPVAKQTQRGGNQTRRGNAPSAPGSASLLTAPSPTVMWAFPLGVVLFLVVMVGYRALPTKTPEDRMDLAKFGRTPLVYEGRTKPYDTLARDSLRVLSGRETFVDQDGKKQPAIVWLLDTIADPKLAVKHKVFRIPSLQILQSFNLEARPGFRYSYEELKPELPGFEEQVDAAIKTEKENVNNYQRKVLHLSELIRLFDALRYSHQLPYDDIEPLEKVQMIWRCERMSQGRVPFSVPTESKDHPWEPLSIAAVRSWIPELKKKMDTQDESKIAATFAAAAMGDENVAPFIEREKIGFLKAHTRRQDDTLTDEEVDARAEAAMRELTPELKKAFTSLARGQVEENLRFSVEAGIEASRKMTKGKHESHPVAQPLISILTAYRAGDVDQFNAALRKYQTALATNPPQQLNEYKTNLEAEYNRIEGFYKCNILYFFVGILAFVAWLTWLVGWNRPLNRAAFCLALVTFGLHTALLIARIYIMDRPPVTNLYSSAIFIGWVCVFAGLVVEVIFRLGIGNVMASVAGFTTLIIAQALAGDGDTMKVLQAVLDTTFWLATHVVCITIGYAATFLAGLIATIYVLAGITTRMLSRQIGQRSLGKILVSMIYGVICFAMFFSFVGTVLGGLWADDSWGRFWGWDPKENGALIIVLWNALVLHARWDGLVKDRGLAVLAVGGNIVTSWSWFGVNQLGIGLHSYGFTQGVLLALALYVLSQLAIIGAGLLPKENWRSFQEPDQAADAS